MTTRKNRRRASRSYDAGYQAGLRGAPWLDWKLEPGLQHGTAAWHDWLTGWRVGRAERVNPKRIWK